MHELFWLLYIAGVLLESWSDSHHIREKRLFCSEVCGPANPAEIAKMVLSLDAVLQHQTKCSQLRK